MHTQCGNWDLYRGLGCLNHFRSSLSYNKRHLNSFPEQIKKNSFSSSSFSEKTRCGRCWETIRVKAGRFIQKYLLNFVIGIVWAQTIIWIFIIVWIIIIWISSLGKRKKKKICWQLWIHVSIWVLLMFARSNETNTKITKIFSAVI